MLGLILMRGGLDGYVVYLYRARMEEASGENQEIDDEVDF